MVQQVTVPSEKPLPHNLEAERCVLGAILIHNDAFNVAAELVAVSYTHLTLPTKA